MGTEDNLIEVTLDKKHTHAGEELTAGAKIKVSLPEARFLLQARVIKEIPAAQLAKAEKAAAAQDQS